MNIIKRPTLIEYQDKYPNAKSALETWYHVIKKSNWNNFDELKKVYPRTDYVGNDRYVFDIKGNNYRLVVIIKFFAQVVYIRWFGTHAEYDKLYDASKL
jgi:mRNA interferase HigB